MSFGYCIVAVSATGPAGALLGVGAADAGLAPLFSPVQVQQDTAEDGQKDGRKNDVAPHGVYRVATVLGASRRYSSWMLRLALRAKVTTMVIITMMPTRPARAAPTFREAGAVIRVPTVYTR